MSGGISTTVSPIGRSSTPRCTAAADTRRPQRKPSAGGASSTPPIKPSRRTSRTAGFDSTRSCSSAAQLVGALAHVVEHVPRFEELEVPQRDRGRERVPAVGVAVIQRALAEVVAEERVEHADRSRP